MYLQSQSPQLQRCSGGKIASPFFTKQVKRTGLAVPESGASNQQTLSKPGVKLGKCYCYNHKDTPKQRFGLGWFKPSIQHHRKVLIEVLVRPSLCNCLVWPIP